MKCRWRGLLPSEAPGAVMCGCTTDPECWLLEILSPKMKPPDAPHHLLVQDSVMSLTAAQYESKSSFQPMRTVSSRLVKRRRRPLSTMPGTCCFKQPVGSVLDSPGEGLHLLCLIHLPPHCNQGTSPQARKRPLLKETQNVDRSDMLFWPNTACCQATDPFDTSKEHG